MMGKVYTGRATQVAWRHGNRWCGFQCTGAGSAGARSGLKFSIFQHSLEIGVKTACGEIPCAIRLLEQDCCR